MQGSVLSPDTFAHPLHAAVVAAWSDDAESE